MDNQTIADYLSDYAAELRINEPNLFRVRAYRWAAEMVRTMERPLTDVLETEGRAGIAALPAIGAHIAYTIEELIRSGEFRTWRSRQEACGAGAPW